MKCHRIRNVPYCRISVPYDVPRYSLYGTVRLTTFSMVQVYAEPCSPSKNVIPALPKTAWMGSSLTTKDFFFKPFAFPFPKTARDGVAAYNLCRFR